jgi:hypothetical protein
MERHYNIACSLIVPTTRVVCRQLFWSWDTTAGGERTAPGVVYIVADHF